MSQPGQRREFRAERVETPPAKSDERTQEEGNATMSAQTTDASGSCNQQIDPLAFR